MDKNSKSRRRPSINRLIKKGIVTKRLEEEDRFEYNIDDDTLESVCNEARNTLKNVMITVPEFKDFAPLIEKYCGDSSNNSKSINDKIATVRALIDLLNNKEKSKYYKGGKKTRKLRNRSRGKRSS